VTRALLISRLAIRDVRHSLPHVLLLLVGITVAMATLTLGLILHGVTARPYQQTRISTNGPDVVASSVGFAGPAGISATALRQFDGLAHAPGVLMTRRPRRALLSCVSFVITGSVIVAVFIFHVSVRGHLGQPGPLDPGHARVSQVLLVLTVVLVLLAAVNVLAITWTTVLDARHFSAIARSLGATRRQAEAGLTAAQLMPALAGTLLAIPAGTWLYAAVQNGGPQASPPGWWLLALVASALLAVAGLTAIPARIAARQPIAPLLAEA
jgi:hypothetical protein